MSLILISWALHRSPGLWEKVDFGSLLGKCIGDFRYLGIGDLPQDEFLIKKVLKKFPDNNTGEIRAGHIFYLLHKLYIVFSKLGLSFYEGHSPHQKKLPPTPPPAPLF